VFNIPNWKVTQTHKIALKCIDYNIDNKYRTPALMSINCIYKNHHILALGNSCEAGDCFIEEEIALQ
jgi:hypothetical protein